MSSEDDDKKSSKSRAESFLIGGVLAALGFGAHFGPGVGIGVIGLLLAMLALFGKD